MEGLSIIIPTLNEEDNVKNRFPIWLEHLKSLPIQLILVDGGSTDQTVAEARALGFEIIELTKSGRALQLNVGALSAKYQELFFLHADVQPPESFWEEINTFRNSSCDFGLFPYQFEPSNYWLNINARQTFKKGPFTGGGDQGLWIRKKIFEDVGRYDEALPIMEDFDLFWRLNKQYNYELAKSPMTVSSRKYKRNAYLKVQLVNLYTFLAFRWGVAPDLLARQYKNWL